MASTAGYLMGVSDAEFERLKLQSDYLQPVTSRLIRETGIGPGMRMLDVGCGMGDVSMLLAQAVGPLGQVVAIDREERAINAARTRAKKAGHDRIEFTLATDEDLACGQIFDAAVGRYVLIHQPDPVAMVRRVAACVRPGGIVAFHETIISNPSNTVPSLELWDRMVQPTFAAVRTAASFPDAGGWLAPIFEDAGLPAPDMFCECVIGGPESFAIPLGVMSYQTLLPVIDRLGLDCSGVGDPDTLRDRLLSAAREARTQFVLNPQTCAWAVVRP